MRGAQMTVTNNVLIARDGLASAAGILFSSVDLLNITSRSLLVANNSVQTSGSGNVQSCGLLAIICSLVLITSEHVLVAANSVSSGVSGSATGAGLSFSNSLRVQISSKKIEIAENLIFARFGGVVATETSYTNVETNTSTCSLFSAPILSSQGVRDVPLPLPLTTLPGAL